MVGRPAAPEGPLSGLLVVDFSRVLAGPFATMLLADLGARVIKIERPELGDDSRAFGPFLDGPDRRRSLYFTRVNRGKQSVTIDLKADADRALLFAMVDRADVVVENFRPGVMARLKLDYPTLADRNPGLVYASISGFGQSGPLRLKPAYDAVVQAMSGVMSITGEIAGRPAKPGVPISDIAGGLYAFGAITAALLGRAATGRGSYIDIGLYDSTLSLLESAGLSYLATGVQPPRTGNAHFSIAPFDTFACADRSIVICAANDVLFRQLCQVLERPELVADPRYASNESRFDHRHILKVEMEATLRQGSAEHWLAQLDTAGVPCSPILDVAEALGSSQAAARRMVVSSGGLPVLGNPIKMSAYPDPAERPPAPDLDADRADLIAEFLPEGAPAS
ncbi:MAG: CaiB/BaiF CoA transferase family protein [Frankiaceae bacterium]